MILLLVYIISILFSSIFSILWDAVLSKHELLYMFMYMKYDLYTYVVYQLFHIFSHIFICISKYI